MVGDISQFTRSHHPNLQESQLTGMVGRKDHSQMKKVEGHKSIKLPVDVILLDRDAAKIGLLNDLFQERPIWTWKKHHRRELWLNQQNQPETSRIQIDNHTVDGSEIRRSPPVIYKTL